MQSDIKARRNVRVPRVYSVGQSTWLSQFLKYATLQKIKPSDRRVYLLNLLNQPPEKLLSH